jgi:hypothetical protein
VIAEKIRSVRAAIGGMAGRVSPQAWEELRAVGRELADAEEMAGNLEAVLTVPQASAVGILQSVRRLEAVQA